MQEAALFSPSQLYKIFLFLLFFNFSFSSIRKDYGYAVIFFTIILILHEIIIGIIFLSGVTHILTGLLNIFKIIYLIVIYLSFKKMIETKKVNVDDLVDYMIINGIICVMLIFTTRLLHFDMATYRSGTFGSKGLFASGNGVGLYIGGISLISLIKLKQNIKLKYIIFALILITGNLYIGTKASFIFLLIDLLFVLFYILFEKSRLIFVLSILLISMLFIKYMHILKIFFDVIILRYEKSDNIFVFLASGRDNYVINAFKEFYYKDTLFFRIFTGLGAFISFRNPYRNNYYFDTLETDFFDIFFMYGIIGLLIFLFLYIKILYNAIKNKIKGIFIFSFLVLSYSIIAGHCLFNAMSGVLIVYAAILSRYKQVEKIKAGYEKNNRLFL
jgi:hypothetical protein